MRLASVGHAAIKRAISNFVVESKKLTFAHQKTVEKEIKMSNPHMLSQD